MRAAGSSTKKGYAATPLAEIAASIRIAQGNLTYHFPTKRELIVEIEKRVRQRIRAKRASYRHGSVADDYVNLTQEENCTYG